MFDRITHGRKLKSQRYAKKGENQSAGGNRIRKRGLAISFWLLAFSSGEINVPKSS